MERIRADTGHAVAYRDAGQTGAIIERLRADTGHAVAYRDAGQTAATVERITTDIAACYNDSF